MSQPKRAVRVLLLLVALLAALAIADFLAWKREQIRLARILVDTGIQREYPQAAEQIRLEPDREQARLRVARALLGSQIDTQRLSQLSSSEQTADRQKGIEHLDLAASLAFETLEHRPGSWQAAFIYGAASYLADFRRGDPNLFVEPATWEQSLQLASDLAPGHPEAPRFLGAIYLGNWSRLSPQRKQKARDLISLAVLDSDSFKLLIEPWLRVAPSTREAFDILPDRPDVWSRLIQIYRAANDLERLRDVQERWHTSLIPHSEDTLREAKRRLGAGDTRRGIQRLQSLVALPPDLRLVGIIEEALEVMPEIHVGQAGSRNYSAWLRWALDLCVVRDCPLNVPTLERLQRVVLNPRPSDSALVALLRGDLHRAEQYERLAPEPLDDPWVGYLGFKAATLAEQGDVERARDTMRWLSGNSARRVSQIRASRALESAAGTPPKARAEPSKGPDPPEKWQSKAWRRVNKEAVLEMNVELAATGFELALEGRTDKGDVVEIQLNGAHLGYYVVRTNTTLRPKVDVEPGYHLLRVVAVKGRFAPIGEVALVRPVGASS